MIWQPAGAASGLDLGLLVVGVFGSQSDQETALQVSRYIRQ